MPFNKTIIANRVFSSPLLGFLGEERGEVGDGPQHRRTAAAEPTTPPHSADAGRQSVSRGETHTQ